MAVPMKNGGMKIPKIIFYVVLSGVTTGIGAFLGAIIGTISTSIIAISLSFAAGSMLYIVSRRANSGSKQTLYWKNECNWKYDRFYNRNTSN